MLREHLKSGDIVKAWQEILDRFAIGEYDGVRREIRNVVCTKYWWTAGEYFIHEGSMGWGPGHREWEEDTLLPAPADGSILDLRGFLGDLARIPESPSIDQLLNARWDFTNISLPARTLRFLHARTPIESELIAHIYGRIAETRTAYELGAARPYFKMSLEDETLQPIALAGLVLILCTRLDPCKVRKELVMSRHPFREGARQMPTKSAFVTVAA